MDASFHLSAAKRPPVASRACDDLPDRTTGGLARRAADQGESHMISALDSEISPGIGPGSLHALRDDALFYEGYAFQQENRMADAANSFGVLLRDYPWSSRAPKVRGMAEPVGPELAPPPKTPGGKL